MFIVYLREESDKLFSRSYILLALLTFFGRQLHTHSEVAHEVLIGAFVGIHAACFDIVVLFLFFLILLLCLALQDLMRKDPRDWFSIFRELSVATLELNFRFVSELLHILHVYFLKIVIVTEATISC